MRRFISWNNKRRSWSYWLAIELLLFTGLNISWWLDTSDPIIKFINSFMMMTFNLYTAKLFIRSILSIHLLVILVIACINHLVGFLPDIKRVKILGCYQMCLKSAFLSDFAVGVLLGGIALAGLEKLGETYQPTSIALWGYYANFLIGSIIYWKQVFPAIQYFKAINLFQRRKDYERKTWYNITNSNLSFSTFDRVPSKGRITEIIVDCFDLAWINFLEAVPIKEEYFVHYLVCIDRGKEISTDFVHTVKKIVNLPHARTIVCLWGDENQGDTSKELENYLSRTKNVKMYDWGRNKYSRNIDIESVLSHSNIKTNDHIFIPYRIIENGNLMHTYMSIGKGPKLCLDFVKTILNDLETLPAIYALFDYIDLQYRIAMSLVMEVDSNWMRKNYTDIGNLDKMGNYIEKDILIHNHVHNVSRISIEEILQSVIHTDEFELIHKYLPHYEMDKKLLPYETIHYLTKHMRNVLRGHGMFEISDADALFVLVFKLALLNTHILNTNSISMRVNCERVWKEQDFYFVIGTTTTGDVRKMSPFFISDTNGHILVFNNWILPTAKDEDKKDKIEYINYLDGSLIMPEFRSITVDDV